MFCIESALERVLFWAHLRCKPLQCALVSSSWFKGLPLWSPAWRTLKGPWSGWRAFQQIADTLERRSATLNAASQMGCQYHFVGSLFFSCTSFLSFQSYNNSLRTGFCIRQVPGLHKALAATPLGVWPQQLVFYQTALCFEALSLQQSLKMFFLMF